MIRHDGYTMVQPTPSGVVEAVGASSRTGLTQCDLAIVGAGPAGLAAAVYAARNYPGFAHGGSGHDCVFYGAAGSDTRAMDGRTVFTN
jgi:hypothetical protein